MRLRLISVLLVFVLLLSGCGSAGAKVPENTERLKELAQEFIDDIAHIYLPLKDTPAEYAGMEMVVSTQSGSYNVGLLQAFVKNQQDKKNGTVTMAFTTSATVFSRVVFEDGVGYYLRYQHDEKKEGEELELTRKYYDSTSLTVNDTATKADMVLYAGKQEVATFSFKNITSSAQASDSSEG